MPQCAIELLEDDTPECLAVQARTQCDLVPLAQRDQWGSGEQVEERGQWGIAQQGVVVRNDCDEDARFRPHAVHEASESPSVEDDEEIDEEILEEVSTFSPGLLQRVGIFVFDSDARWVARVETAHEDPSRSSRTRPYLPYFGSTETGERIVTTYGWSMGEDEGELRVVKTVNWTRNPCRDINPGGELEPD